MNTLGYGLLSLLSHSPLSGYDLMLRIQPLWPAKHSQIYPLLANLEKEEQVRFEVVAQSDKPDKKVYSITDQGIASLQEWLSEPASDPVLRDELMLKAYCLSLVDAAISRKLFVSRLDFYRGRMKFLEDKISQMRDMYGLNTGEIPAYSSSHFGFYVLLHKAFLTCRTDIEWCEWVLGVLPASET
jgi:PadR family transcriptional regulator, regulatory protein AphA